MELNFFLSDYRSMQYMSTDVDFVNFSIMLEILRQVWDLSDQDNDSMLSMREFCVALYLMERFREGRPLPSTLPNSVKFDQTLILATGQPSSTFGASAWQPRPGSSCTHHWYFF